MPILIKSSWEYTSGDLAKLQSLFPIIDTLCERTTKIPWERCEGGAVLNITKPRHKPSWRDKCEPHFWGGIFIENPHRPKYPIFKSCLIKTQNRGLYTDSPKTVYTERVCKALFHEPESFYGDPIAILKIAARDYLRKYQWVRSLPARHAFEKRMVRRAADEFLRGLAMMWVSHVATAATPFIYFPRDGRPIRFNFMRK